MSKEYQAKQAALVAEHIKKQDIVITTALIPGRPAPRLVTAEMVASMKPGSVIVDLAVERGGNVEGAKAGEVVDGRTASRSSATPTWRAGSRRPRPALYAKNLYTFLDMLIDKKAKALAVNWDDEIVKATALTRDGAVVHPSFQPKTETAGLEETDMATANPQEAAAGRAGRRRSRAPGGRSRAAICRSGGRARGRDRARGDRRRDRPVRVPASRSSCWRCSSAITWCGR